MSQSSANKIKPMVLVALSAALMFFYGFILGGMQLVLDDIANLFQTGQTGKGMLVSAQHITSALAPVCMGLLADKIGKKKVLVAFSAVFGIGCAVCGFSNTIAVYTFGITLTGAGYSVCESLSSAVLTDLDSKNGIRYINICQCLLSVGAVISPLLLQASIRYLGADWRLAFYVCAAAFLILAGLLSCTVFPKPVLKETTKRSGSYRQFLTVVFVCLVLAMIFYVGLENGFGYFVNTLFADHLQSGNLGAYAISLYWAGMALCRLVCSLKAYKPIPMLLGCFFLSAVLLAVLAVCPWGGASLACCFLVGAAFAPVWSTLAALAAAQNPEHSGAAIGLMSTGCGLGGIVFPTVMGYVSEHYRITTAFFLLCVTACVGLVLCFTVKYRQKNQ